MQEVINFLRQIELGPHATTILDFLESADPLFIGLLVSVFVCLGYKMVGANGPLRSWGIRIGVAAFLAHGGFAVYQSGGFNESELGDIATRAGIVGGAVLAVIWVVLPIFVFAYRHIRLALAAFMIYFAYEVITIGEWPAEDLSEVSLRSAMAAALAVTVAWILQPISDALFGKLLPGATAKKKKTKTKEQRQARQLRRLRRQYQQLLEAKSATTPMQTASNDEKGELMSRLQIEMRRRRDKARMSVELTYVLAMPEIGGQFPRDMFEGWVNRYLGDHLSPEEVEENSQQLQKLISQYAHRESDVAQIPTLEELNQWLVDEKKRIQSLDITEAQKQTKLIELQDHYISLAHRIMRDSHPSVVSLPAKRTVPFKESQSM